MNASLYLSNLTCVLKNIDNDEIADAINLIRSTWLSGKKIITFGNGGSALTASHFINDWNKSIFACTGIPFRGVCLTDNVGLLLSYANDISFHDIFKEQLKNIAEPGDLAIAISGSGNSKNIINAVEYCNENDIVTLGLCGFNGGLLKTIAKHSFWSKSMDMQYSEDVHFIFGHIVMKILSNEKLC